MLCVGGRLLCFLFGDGCAQEHLGLSSVPVSSVARSKPTQFDLIWLDLIQLESKSVRSG